MLVILDTNIIVQAVIGSPRGASSLALRAYGDGKYRLAFSPQTFDESEASFLVTNDHRHLLRLKRHGQTRIVTPAAFLRQLQ